MATQIIPSSSGPVPESRSEPRLSYDQGWDLFFSLFGTGREMYAKVGGAEAFMAAERAAWDEERTK